MDLAQTQADEHSSKLLSAHQPQLGDTFMLTSLLSTCCTCCLHL